ncbi:hypothetical protein ACPPVT_11185 [Angustibacter sp. McL0619]|uniref:hypothetical protein n=1 Tax=Angustibacter sp. McL0619 TaxID=3415676 RepID=UPI003CF37F67
MTAFDVRTMPAGLADAVAAHLNRVARPPRSTQQLLASAYAQRLSLLRSAASEKALHENSRLIDRLETRHGTELAATAVTIDLRDMPNGQPRTALTPDPALYLG